MRTALLILILCIATHNPGIMQQFSKTVYYQTLKKGSLKEINDQLAVIDAASFNNKAAFKGALLMRKAGVVSVPKQKLDFFKSGRIKLETEIKNDSTNTEFRFLRLIIQEHAPKTVKYNSNVNGDVAYIKSNYKNLDAEVQKIVVDYSQSSKYLKPADLN
jgi:hypothetical protein